MQKPAKYASLMATLDNGTAIVLPAYETGDAGDIGVEVAREAVLGELADVLLLMDACGCCGRAGADGLRMPGCVHAPC